MNIKRVKLREYTDARGNLVENTLKTIITHSKHFFVSKSKPNVIRGNHYHKKKSEWFYVIQGTCKVLLEDITTKKRGRFIVSSSDNEIICIGPKLAHAFQNIGKNEMILLAFINEVHKQNSPDTFSYKLM